MINPYDVLNVSPTATDVEIRAAYRTLMKKYHPDKYSGAPDLIKVAEMKSRDINEAMHMIKVLREQQADIIFFQESENDVSIKFPTEKYFNDEVRDAINNSDLNLADRILLSVPEPKRNAEWWFCYAVITKRRGWDESALTYMKRACEMSPDDPEFHRAKTAMEESDKTIVGKSRRIAINLLGAAESP